MLFCGIIFLFAFGLTEADGIGIGNVAVIAIHGPISATDSVGFSSKGTKSDDVVGLIEKAEKQATIKAIILDINSPGGTAVGSAEIADAMKRAQKPTVAVIRETGASGAYWIATSADHVIAHPASITGSIGVIASSLEFDELIEEYNISYRRMVSGRLKDIGSPFRDMTDEERMLFQASLDEMHVIFKEAVAENRNIPIERVNELATGMFYTGRQALDLGLVDQLGTMYDANVFLEQQLGEEVDVVKFEKPKTFADVLFSSFQDYAFEMGRGIGTEVIADEPVEVRT
ncbi:signal peptide peptidase SppA [Candidatus Woesearchaeota archaeon]|nr:signal peptide peptidase SppA [Candidatus Woesearchaeota archaeon]